MIEAALTGAICLSSVVLAGGLRAKSMTSYAGVALFSSLTTLCALHVSVQRTASDRFLYVRHFELLATADSPFSTGVTGLDDPGFNIFAWLLAKFSTNDIFLYATITVLSATVIFVASRLVMSASASYLVVYTLVASGFFISYSSVAVRQGLAIPLLMVAAVLYAMRRGSLLLFALLLLSATSLHWSAGPLAACLLLLRIGTPSLRWLIGGWAGAAILYVTSLNSRILAGIAPEVDRYGSDELFAAYGGMSGVRLDFFAVSAVGLLVGVAGSRWLEGSDLWVYRRLLSVYVVFNAAFLALGFVAFSDRIAAFSWFLLPLLLWFAISRSARDRSILAVLLACGITILGLATTGGLQALL